MATLLPSIVNMQRHLTGEVELLRQNMHKLEDSVGRLSNIEAGRVHPSAETSDGLSNQTQSVVVQLTHDVLNVDLKLDQHIADFQRDQSQKTLLLHDISLKLDDEVRNSQLRSDIATQKAQDCTSKVEGIYATSHGDHIRLDVLNANVQDIFATIGTLRSHVDAIGASMSQVASDFGAYQTTINGRLDLLERAASAQVVT